MNWCLHLNSFSILAHAVKLFQGPSASAYVTYFKSEDALRAIQAVNNIYIDGRTLKASLGTTKYCSHFMKNQNCPKNDCMYLHELGKHFIFVSKCFLFVENIYVELIFFLSRNLVFVFYGFVSSLHMLKQRSALTINVLR